MTFLFLCFFRTEGGTGIGRGAISVAFICSFGVTGSRIVISILCVPLAAGYVRPPQLKLPNVDESNISCNPPGPHLVCVMPPALSSSFCIPA